MSPPQHGYQSGWDADLFLGSCPSDYNQISISSSQPKDFTHSGVLRGLADPQCHCQILQTLQTGRPAHGQYSSHSLYGIPTLSYRKS
jgi:hypothetical protein